MILVDDPVALQRVLEYQRRRLNARGIDRDKVRRMIVDIEERLRRIKKLGRQN